MLDFVSYRRREHHGPSTRSSFGASSARTLVATLGARRFEPRQGKTVIVVDVIDQAHLHGILESLRDQAIDIERVNPV